jgi:hypothetical protein
VKPATRVGSWHKDDVGDWVRRDDASGRWLVCVQEGNAGAHTWFDDSGYSTPAQTFDSLADACNAADAYLVSRGVLLPGAPAVDATNPAHYRAGTVETIDAIRAALGDAGLIAFCRGNVLKYRARAGLKTADPAEDLAKAAWYEAMAWHVAGHGADPRTYLPAGGGR